MRLITLGLGLCCFLVVASLGSAHQPTQFAQLPDEAFHAFSPSLVIPSAQNLPPSAPPLLIRVPVRVPDRVLKVSTKKLTHPVPAPVEKQTKTTPAPAARSTHSVRGNASWYCNYYAGRAMPSKCANGYPDTPGYNAYAAAGPRLRAAICGVQSCTSWRGRTVMVNGIPVKLVDWCQCYWHQSNEKLIDLYYDVFGGDRNHPATGSSVTIRW